MPAAEPALSVVIAAWNARDTIAACLDSLAAQTVADRMEILVIDSEQIVEFPGQVFDL